MSNSESILNSYTVLNHKALQTKPLGLKTDLATRDCPVHGLTFKYIRRGNREASTLKGLYCPACSAYWSGPEAAMGITPPTGTIVRRKNGAVILKHNNQYYLTIFNKTIYSFYDIEEGVEVYFVSKQTKAGTIGTVNKAMPDDANKWDSQDAIIAAKLV